MQTTAIVLVEKMALLRSEMLRLKQDINDFSGRADTVIKQEKRGLSVRHKHIGEDFTAIIAAAKLFAANSTAFWEAAESYARAGAGGNECGECQTSLKAFISRAREMNKDIDELRGVISRVHGCAQGLADRQDWWELNAASDDLGRLTSRIAFVVRELARRSEKQARSCDN